MVNLSVWHGDLKKRKPSGGRKRASRKKRRFESGSFAAETLHGKPKKKKTRCRGGTTKIRLLRESFVCVSNSANGETQKVEILRVVKNPANVNYNRRGVITKGAILETSLGLTRVTSRPGQDGVINAILLSEASGEQ